jgi:kynureninase
MNIDGIMGLHAALELLLETGIADIAEKLARFRRIIKPALLERDFDLVSPVADARGSGIISFTSPDVDIPTLRQKLDDNGIVVSLRDGLDGLKCLRVSPHYYNTEEEIGQFLDALSRH